MRQSWWKKYHVDVFMIITQNRIYNPILAIMVYNNLALFTAVAQHLSFSAAASQIGIPLSRISRRIAELEDHLVLSLDRLLELPVIISRQPWLLNLVFT